MSEEDQITFGEEWSDDALLLPESQAVKVFTAERLERNARLREAVLMLLGAGFPVEVVSQRLKLSPSTVRELRNRLWQQVGGEKSRLGKVLLGVGGRWFGLAQAREESASFRDLAIAGGIAVQRGAELLAMGESAESVEIKEAGPDPAAVTERLRVLLVEDAGLATGPEPAPGDESGAASDAQSGESTSQVVES